MTNPVILALADESDAFTLIVQELRKRYGNAKAIAGGDPARALESVFLLTTFAHTG
jgi:hypothetical protein